MAHQWKAGDFVWAARFGCLGKIEAVAVKVASAGPKQARPEKMHEAMNCRTNIGHDEGSPTRRGALEALRTEVNGRLETARALEKTAEAQLRAVAAALDVEP